jgi:hypothetical protein
LLVVAIFCYIEAINQKLNLKLEKKAKPITMFCPNCGNLFHKKLHRSWSVKTFLFFLPLRKYNCENCDKDVYVMKNI